jgi:hypothetical protein
MPQKFELVALKKAGSQSENLKEQLVEKLPQSSPTIEPAAVTPATNAPIKKQPKLHKPDQPAFLSQSLGRFTGRLSAQDRHLFLVCPDGAILPVAGVYSKLAIWLLAHPEQIASEQHEEWLVYPKASYKTNDLIVTLRGRLQPERFEVNLDPDTAIVKGRLLEVHDGWFTIGIRRNLSPQAYSELAKKKMLSDEFQQFRVCVNGVAPGEVGQMVELNCRREGERLVIN